MPEFTAVDLEGVPQILRDLRDIAPWMLTAIMVIVGAKFALPPVLDALANLIRALRGK